MKNIKIVSNKFNKICAKPYNENYILVRQTTEDINNGQINHAYKLEDSILRCHFFSTLSTDSTQFQSKSQRALL